MYCGFRVAHDNAAFLFSPRNRSRPSMKKQDIPETCWSNADWRKLARKRPPSAVGVCNGADLQSYKRSVIMSCDAALSFRLFAGVRSTSEAFPFLGNVSSLLKYRKVYPVARASDRRGSSVLVATIAGSRSVLRSPFSRTTANMEDRSLRTNSPPKGVAHIHSCE